MKHIDWPVADPGGQDEETVRDHHRRHRRPRPHAPPRALPDIELPPSVLA
ncbi:hypothetical protein Q9S36_42245 [Microbacterium sp. ARD31]|nr:hypothetical protein [Microbacterium sp. ARD31]MDT0186826.1 hypothetical protein [Microbacterium sp. ARD31]